MKKLIYVLFIFILGINFSNAKPVTPKTAQKVAENFYKLNSAIEFKSITLVYTEVSKAGAALYYVFNINNNDGFVIITADDAGKPIIGYSTEKNFVVPETGSTIGIWLQKRAQEVLAIQEKSLVADEKTAKQWDRYSNTAAEKLVGNSVTSTTVAPLVQSTWNQSPNYNALCPGGSVTGCVATAMAQIMRFWNYPAHGTGSSSYNAGSYGTLSANYGAATYNWTNMPLALMGANNDVAVINYHAGVSVNMNYSPTGSGAYVITGDNPICAQHSFVTYFGYDPTTIKGLYRSSYNDASWIALLKTDLDIGRPIQYVGWDPNQGGHTWVCDGYDQNDFFHMNWGWGGSSNGFFDLNNLNTGGYNPSQGHEALMGIVPVASVALDAGIPAVYSPTGFYCSNSFTPNIKLQNFGANSLTSCTINYQIDNGTVQTQSWNGTLVSGQSTIVSLPTIVATSGSHTLVCYSSNPNGSTDANTANDQSSTSFNVTLGGGILPIAEGFETNTLPSTDWAVSHISSGVDWAVTSSAAATGVKSAMIDNTSNPGGSSSILQTVSSYDLASYNSPALTFKMAYQPKTTNNNDKLQVLVSTDCGASWQSKWARIGAPLATVSGTASTFVPTPAQFTSYTVNINSVLSSHKVLFRWLFVADANGPGNNLFLDDINIFDAAPNAIQSLTTDLNLNIYPNPSSSNVNVEFSLSEQHNVAIHVTDVLGRTIETIDARTYNAGETTLTIGAKNTYQAGVYLVNINVDGQLITKKVLIN